MLLYLSMVAIVPVLYTVFYKNEHRDKVILAVVCSMMFILLALRKPFSDVISYQTAYNSFKGISLREVLKDFHLIKTSSFGKMEWGYSFLCWLFVTLGVPFQVFLAVESAFCVFCVYDFVRRNSVNIPLSIALIIGFGAFDYMFIVIRQSMAFGFLLLSVESIKKRNLPVFLLFVLAAMMIHRTAALFLIVYPLSYLPITRLNVAIFSCASLLIFPLYPVLEKHVVGKIMFLFSKEIYMLDVSFEFSELILVIVLIVVVLMLFPDFSKKSDVKTQTVFWAFLISLPIQAVTCYLSIMGRLSTLMYLPFASVAIPNLLEINDNKKLVKVLEILFYVAVFAYYAFCLYYDKRILEIVPYRLFFID